MIMARPASSSALLLLLVALIASSLVQSMQYETSDGPSLRRIRREDDTAMLKKATTKKPTNMIKQKPSLAVPLKTSSSSSVTPETQPSSAGSSSSPTPSPSSPLAVTDYPLIHPEDVTLPSNSSENEDHHMYYNSTVLGDHDEAMKYWANLSNESGVEYMTHEMLSNSHRRAATIALKFKFPFYGHPISNVTIATGGFLYLGDTVHSWLAATQYIAPLMANFDTSISNTSSIKYINNATTFVVQWNDVQLQDQANLGNFSFQVTLHNTGDIVFVYKELPLPIEQVPDSKHPVKVGISDAYVIDRTVFFIRRKTIYEYHRADLKKQPISNQTAIYFAALPTCVSLTSCEACLSAKINFDCKWCDAVQRCSDGFDRHRQEWLMQKCETDATTAKDKGQCKAPGAVSPTPATNPQAPVVPGERQKDSEQSRADKAKEQRAAAQGKQGGHGAKIGFVTLLVIVAMISGVGLWVYYAYRNPTSGAGQFLIKYRPAEWHWRPSDARYTAASIHM